ncbi:MAG: Hsp20/alpha crystallin family protein [Acetobacteraceae bacterium]|nr:Hsp20/alpha crystallin family protein [Acetobacteraceae bacterium]
MLSRFFGPSTGLAQPGDPFGTIQREMGRIFDEVLRGFPMAGGDAGMMGRFAPRLDVHETDRGLEVSAELPGMSEQDIDLRVDGDLLVIAGEKKQERREEQQGGMHLSERSYGRFQRAFRLPFAPDPNQVEARFDRGVLHITLPRPAEQQKPSRIPIRSTSQSAGQASGGAQAQAANEQDNRPGQQQRAG